LAREAGVAYPTEQPPRRAGGRPQRHRPLLQSCSLCYWGIGSCTVHLTSVAQFLPVSGKSRSILPSIPGGTQPGHIPSLWRAESRPVPRQAPPIWHALLQGQTRSRNFPAMSQISTVMVGKPCTSLTKVRPDPAYGKMPALVSASNLNTYPCPRRHTILWGRPGAGSSFCRNW
jgi:hypothetical protein